MASVLLEPVLRTKIMDWNLGSYGLSVEQAMENVGKGVAGEVEKKFGKGKRIAIFCGLGNNGGDGSVAARYLCVKNKVTVYLLGEPSGIRTAEAKKNWERLASKKEVERIAIKDAREVMEKQSEFGKFDIILDCLLGVGVSGELREPIKSCVKVLNAGKGAKISVDVPTPDFRADLIVSAGFAKIKGASVVSIGVSDEMEEAIGPGNVKALYSPPENSHKGENGKLLIVAGSDEYHGSAVLAAKAASKFCDLIYFASTSENNEIVKKMKFGLAEVIVVDRKKVDEFAEKCDAILIGPGIGVAEDAKKLTNGLLKKFGGKNGKKFVLDADALKLVDLKLLDENCVLTPHGGEFVLLFGKKGDEKEVLAQAKKFGGCTILLKGAKADLISDGEVLRKNLTGNQGMTKGGTGDVLAGLCGALACKNPPVLAACAAAYLNGAAGDLCFREMDTAYNASDLIEKLGKAYKLARS
ncbi:ADP-dependent (S)-NAD(P)H-hydrate dehydratase [Candidatus Gugararchaeum adminiculabundum]|nr:ADP-dependent (S)-NAD(P)H-hydrate dehydratase [Candidatus Gugararchaeum adminiculabundum]